MNKVMIIGNLGGDVTLGSIPGGGHVANFSVATTDKWKDKAGNRQERTEWFHVAVFGPLADIVSKHISKGSQVFIEGRLHTEEYEKDGEKRRSVKLIVDQKGQVVFIGGAGSSKREDDDF